MPYRTPSWLRVGGEFPVNDQQHRGVRCEVVMGDTKKPSAQSGESVTTDVSASDTEARLTHRGVEHDLQAEIEQAEAEAAEAEAAAAAARARVRAIRLDRQAETDGEAETDDEAEQAQRPWYRRRPR